MTYPASLLVIYGATGDLARRMLLPSLFGLDRDGLLPDGLSILCCARESSDTAAFRALLAPALAANLKDDTRLDGFLQRVDYHATDFSEPGALDALTQTIAAQRRGDILFHLSTAPNWYAPICASLQHAGLTGPGTRVMLEKPIGRDLESSRAINDDVGAVFNEAQIFRVDHYLGKDGVQNLLALRFGNALFEPLWSARHIDQVQITVSETIGVEGRSGYYDEYGAARDMIQNHLLQLLCLTAMEPPSEFEPDAVRNEKVKVLRSLRPIGGPGLAGDVATGQYAPGMIDGMAVPGYIEELGADSQTETYVALRAHIDNWRWSQVPFYLRTGKRLPRRMTEIYLRFRSVPHSIFRAAEADLQPNALLIRLQPEECISLYLMNKLPGLDRGGVRLAPVALNLDLGDAFRQNRRHIAYERLYLDAIESNGTLFVRRDEIESAWQWIDRILQDAAQSGLQPRPYPAGTWGPSSAVALTERHGHSWRE